MEELSSAINQNNSILVSRNLPLALVVGVAGFIGSRLAEELISKNIQVVGIDDFSTGSKKNLQELIKSNKFHLLSKNITNKDFFDKLELSHLDYLFFVADDENPHNLLNKGLGNVLEYVKSLKENKKDDERHKDSYAHHKSNEKPRIVFVSKISLYGNKLEQKDEVLKEAEIRFARYVKHYKLNARIVRLAAVYGPRMHFRNDDPVGRLIQAAVLGKLEDENSSQDFSSRDLYVDDAVNLIIKSALSGGTAQKIYDGANINPIKVSEIKQILLDPEWHKRRDFKVSELPPWASPNLVKTMKELSWRVHTNVVDDLAKTLEYFKENKIEVPKLEEKLPFENVKGWSFKDYQPISEGKDEGELREEEEIEEKEEKKIEEESKKKKGVKPKVLLMAALLLIFAGLILPFVSLSVGAFTIRENLKYAAKSLEAGDFDKADSELKKATQTTGELKNILGMLAIFKKMGVAPGEIERVESLTDLVDEGIDGVNQAVAGTESLYQATKVISGESRDDAKPLYEKSQIDLTGASGKIAKIQARLNDEGYVNQYPGFIKVRMEDLGNKLNSYSELVDKARSASFLLPQITAIDGKKSYLVLLQNNLELRPGGGFIGSYAKLDFENGRLINIKVDDIYNLDGQLKDVIAPPAEIKTDLGQDRFYLRDSNTEADFPTSARQAEFFYKKITGENVNGVFAMDLSSSARLLNAVGGLDLPEYSEHVDGDNLFERAITHAEVNFFPGSQAKRNYLTSLQLQLFNKIFYLSNQNWPAIIQAVGDSLEQKHMMVYLADPSLFSFLVSENWAGVLPRGSEVVEGQTNDLLAISESNMGANKSNYYLDRKIDLKVAIGKESELFHTLTINYKNNSPSTVFPAGAYKNRIKIYLPLGAKLTKVTFGDEDITKNVGVFSDYGRTGFSTFVTINPKEEKRLVYEYQLSGPLSFKDRVANYRLDVIKQPGTNWDQFNFNFTYPIHMSLVKVPSQAAVSDQDVTISTDMVVDRAFDISLQKNQ